MKKLIQVCGDPTVDWFRIHDEEIIVKGGVYYWEKPKEDIKVRLSSKLGGSAMIHQLVQKMIPGETAVVEGSAINEELLSRPKDSRITTSWTVWKEYPNPGFSHHSYRLEKWHEFEPGSWDYAAAKLQGRPDLLIIHDTNLGFRSIREGWPECLTAETADQLPGEIIFHIGQYNKSLHNPILDQIAALGLEDRTTIITAISDLRSCAVKIGLSLSWERMMQEVTAAVLSKNCPFADARGQQIKYQRVIVTLGASGTIIVGREKTTLIFDRTWQEGEFASHFPGQVMGYHACMIGALAADWVRKGQEFDLVGACAKGLKSGRQLHVLGYEVAEKDNYKQLAFPYSAIADFYQQLAEAESSDAEYTGVIHNLGFFSMSNEALTGADTRDDWTILEEKLLKRQLVCFAMQDPQHAVVECARNIVLAGSISALPDVPVETIGAWSSADRQEIEGVRSVKNAMQEYLRLKKPKNPLCVAVFGPPGAGKSFVVKEIAKGLGISENAQLTFNLSQFESPRELLTAFHQIRDLNLQGRMPLVFWDEFDNPCEGQALGWLRYFLAPMQDGEFSDQGIARPLGGGIHVFAGATRHSFAEFQQGNTKEDRNAKKPDFISRLSAFINIRGINGNPNTVEDRLYMIRRAFILRHYLETYAPQIRTNENHFNIEAGVLDALLRVNKYYHGARSLENLIKMSSLADKRKFELSSLPPDNIIGMHVNVKEFNDLTTMSERETLTIGIAGHTSLDPRQTDRLEQAVNEAINNIEQQFDQHYLTIYSTLAAGAERLIVRQLLKREAARLIAILPLPREEYLEEFAATGNCCPDDPGVELRKEMQYWLEHKAIEIIEMPPSATRQAAFTKAGNYIAEYSDILIVLWDGNQEGGSPLTVQILEKADKLHKPICHIWAENFGGETEQAQPQNIDKCGEIVYRNFA